VAVSLLAACGDKDASTNETPNETTPDTAQEVAPPASDPVTLPDDAAPTISGSPETSVSPGSSYTFTPSASDPDNSTLAFSILNKPSWATFSTADGSLEGTAQVGTYADITISVSDGTSTRTLPAFTLDVVPEVAGTAALSWSAPTHYMDGTPLTDLAGYRVYRGDSPSTLNEVIELPGASNTAYTFNQLAIGTHYFAVSAYNSLGTESSISEIGSKTIL